MVVFMINDGSAKAVSYVQNCHETKNGHIPHCPQASIYCKMLLTHFTSISAFGSNRW